MQRTYTSKRAMRHISITLLAVLGAAEEDSCAEQRLLCSDNVLPHERSQVAPALLQMKRRAPAHFVHMQATGASTMNSLNESEVQEFFVPHHGREGAHLEQFPRHEMNGAQEHHELLGEINSAKERRSSAVAANIDPESEDPEIKIAKVEMEPVQVVGEDYKVKDGLIPFQVTNMSMKEMNDMSKAIMQFVAWLLFGNMVIILVVCIWQAFSPRRKSLATSAELSKLSDDDQATRSPQITSLAQLTALAQAPLLDATLTGPTASTQSQKPDGVPHLLPSACRSIDSDILKFVSSTNSSTGEDARRRSSSARRSSSSRASSRRRTSLSPKAKDDSRCLWTVDALCTPSTGRRASVA